MTTLTDNDDTMPGRLTTHGLVHSAFGGFIKARDRKGRRHALGPSIHFDRLDLSDIERRSLFDTGAPERR